MNNTLAVVFPLYHLQTNKSRSSSFAYVLKMVEEKLHPAQVIISEQLKPGESKYTDYQAYANLLHVTYEREGDDYCKSQAINLGVKQVTASVVMILDADVALKWDEVLARAQTLEVGTVLKPFSIVHRLNKPGTIMFMRSGRTLRIYITDTSNVAGGGAVIMHKSDFIRLGGFDERYVGWGVEDEAFGRECRRYLTVEEMQLPGYHLWHPRDKKALLDAPAYKHNRQLFRATANRFVFDSKYVYTKDSPPPHGPLDHDPNPSRLGSCAMVVPVFLPLVASECEMRINAISTALKKWKTLQKWLPTIYIYEVYFNRHPLLKTLAEELGIVWRGIEAYEENLIIFQKEAILQQALQSITEDRVACFDGDIYSTDPYWLYKVFYLLTKSDNIMVQPMQWIADDKVGYEQWSFAMQYERPGEKRYHPGYGVAVNRDWFLKAGGFNLYCITGSGDNMLWGEYCPDTRKLSPSWSYKWISDMLRTNMPTGKMMCPASSIIHVWHGDYAQRAYRGSRYIFDTFGAPCTFVEIDSRNKLLRWKDPSSVVRRIMMRRNELVDIPTTEKIIAEELAKCQRH